MLLLMKSSFFKSLFADYSFLDFNLKSINILYIISLNIVDFKCSKIPKNKLEIIIIIKPNLIISKLYNIFNQCLIIDNTNIVKTINHYWNMA